MIDNNDDGGIIGKIEDDMNVLKLGKGAKA